jgi:hypothetical protein
MDACDVLIVAKGASQVPGKKGSQVDGKSSRGDQAAWGINSRKQAG